MILLFLLLSCLNRVLARLDVKTRLMALMSHKDPGVAKAALLAVQKIMVAKWDAMLAQGKEAPTSPRS